MIEAPFPFRGAPIRFIDSRTKFFAGIAKVRRVCPEFQMPERWFLMKATAKDEKTGETLAAIYEDQLQDWLRRNHNTEIMQLLFRREQANG